MSTDNNLYFPFLTRLLHWALAACVIANLWITDSASINHENIGITAFIIVVIRILGSPWLGFPKIQLRTKYFIQHANEVRHRQFTHKYNPLSSLMIWLMWIWVLLTALSGYIGYYYEYDYEWAAQLMRTHEFFTDWLEYLVILHFIAITFISLWCRRNLVLHMIFKR